MTFDWTLVPWLLLSAVLGLPRLVAGLESAGRLPGWLSRWNRKRAHDLVEREHADAAVAALVGASTQLVALAEKSDAILKAVQPDHGLSIPDALERVEGALATMDAGVKEIAAKVESTDAKVDTTTTELHNLKRTVEAHLSLHLDGPAA